MTLLDIKDLAVEFDTIDGPIHAVRGVSFGVEQGEALGIVGESGSGKSVGVLAIMRLLARNARVTDGEINFGGQDLLALSSDAMRALRGRRISMIFQDPMTALEPVKRVGRQIGEAIEFHNRAATWREVSRRVVETLESVGVPDAARRARQYPHQWSGGMRQRAVIAMALINDPDLIIADEPTTALDATVQAQVLDVLRTAREERGCAVIMISHDLGVVSEVADRVMVMYAGRGVEIATTEHIFANPRHPYTRALIRARPSWDGAGERLFTIAGRPPDLLQAPGACPFAPRCTETAGSPACHREEPPLQIWRPGHESACHRFSDLPAMEEQST